MSGFSFHIVNAGPSRNQDPVSGVCCFRAALKLGEVSGASIHVSIFPSDDSKYQLYMKGEDEIRKRTHLNVLYPFHCCAGAYGAFILHAGRSQTQTLGIYQRLTLNLPGS